MIEHSALESLVQRLFSFNESVDEEAVAVANTLATFENMVELSSEVSVVLRSPLPCMPGAWASARSC
jgi:hypothetical protein